MKRSLNWLMNGSSRSVRSRHKSADRRLRVEQLENRLLMAADLGWAIGIGSTELRDESYDVATDAAGNSFIAGWFSGTMDFDPTAVHLDNSDILTSVGLHDTFVAKYSSAGQFAWATQMGGSGNDSYDYAYSIAVDGFGDAVVTGAYGGNATFGSISLVSNGGEDAYVAKLSGLDGDVIWARGLGGTTRDFGRSVAVNMNTTGDGAGDVFVSGGLGSSAYFLAKYRANGTQDWVKSVPNSDLTTVHNIAVDSKTGSVFTTGNYFTQKLDGNGAVQWAKNIPGYDITVDSTVDSTGNAYITGGFSGSRDFDPGKGKLTLRSAGGSDVHVTKLDPNGNLEWATRIGGKGGDEGRSIALDVANNIYVAGHFSGKVDFDPGAGTSYLSSVWSRDIFAVKLDSNANLVWAGSMGGTGDEWIWGMTVDTSDNVLLSGYFSGTMDVDPSSAAYNLTSNGGYDSFLVKWTQQPAALLAASSTSVSVNRYTEKSGAESQVTSLQKSPGKEAAALIDVVHASPLDLLQPATLPVRDAAGSSDRDSLELIDWESLDVFDWDSLELLK